MAPPLQRRRAILGREAQLAELATVAGLHGEISSKNKRVREPVPPLVIVYGGVSTGKSFTVHHALHEYAQDFAMVDCTGVTTTRAFYREILGQLQSHRTRRRRSNLASGLEMLATVIGTATEEPQELLDDEITITGAPVESLEDKASTQQEGKEEGDSDEDASSSEAEGDDEDKSSESVVVADESMGSLNFLSFVKALRAFMARDTVTVSERDPTPHTVFITLDHVEKLLDRGLDKLLTCLLAVNDQLDYLHVFDTHGSPWRLSVVLIARAVSLKLDLFLHGAHPAFVHFPAYTKDQVAAIVAQNLLDASFVDPFALSKDRLPWLRKWLAYVYDLLPRTHNDWLEFQHIVAQMLPSFHEFFDLVSRDEHAQLPQLVTMSSSASSSATANGSDSVETPETDTAKAKSWKSLQQFSQDRVSALERSRRRHLFGYDNVAGPVTLPSQINGNATAAELDAALAPVTSGDPVAFIASSKLSRSCLLLLVAAYLASFTPHEADAHFVSGSGGVRRKRRIKRITVESGGSNGTSNEANGPNSKKKDLSTAAARKAMNQQLVGPKIFQLPRLLAIYASLQLESDAAAASNERQEEPVNGQDPAAAPPIWAAGAYRQDGQASRTRADIFTHLALLVRLRLLQRASPPSDLDEPLFRCVADTRLVDEIARRLHFPLDSYLNTRG